MTQGTQAFTYTRDEIANAARIYLFDRAAHLAAWAQTETRREGCLSSLAGIVTLVLWMFHEGWLMFAFGQLTLAIWLGRRFAPGRWIYMASVLRAVVTTGVMVADVVAQRITPWWFGFGPGRVRPAGHGRPTDWPRRRPCPANLP